jgi:hypothetical protein
MTIQNFIEKAIEGGWKPSEAHSSDVTVLRDGIVFTDLDKGVLSMALEQVFLDPEAWKAVGRVQGWDVEVNKTGETHDDYLLMDDHSWVSSGRKKWHHKMHAMIDALAEGKSIEDFINTL